MFWLWKADNINSVAKCEKVHFKPFNLISRSFPTSVGGSFCNNHCLLGLVFRERTLGVCLKSFTWGKAIWLLWFECEYFLTMWRKKGNLTLVCSLTSAIIAIFIIMHGVICSCAFISSKVSVLQSCVILNVLFIPLAWKQAQLVVATEESVVVVVVIRI